MSCYTVLTSIRFHAAAGWNRTELRSRNSPPLRRQRLLSIRNSTTISCIRDGSEFFFRHARNTNCGLSSSIRWVTGLLPCRLETLVKISRNIADALVMYDPRGLAKPRDRARFAARHDALFHYSHQR